MVKAILGRFPHILTVVTLVLVSMVLVQKHDLLQAAFCMVNAVAISVYIGHHLFTTYKSLPARTIQLNPFTDDTRRAEAI